MYNFGLSECNRVRCCALVLSWQFCACADPTFGDSVQKFYGTIFVAACFDRNQNPDYAQNCIMLCGEPETRNDVLGHFNTAVEKQALWSELFLFTLLKSKNSSVKTDYFD